MTTVTQATALVWWTGLGSFTNTHSSFNAHSSELESQCKKHYILSSYYCTPWLSAHTCMEVRIEDTSYVGLHRFWSMSRHMLPSAYTKVATGKSLIGLVPHPLSYHWGETFLKQIWQLEVCLGTPHWTASSVWMSHLRKVCLLDWRNSFNDISTCPVGLH